MAALIHRNASQGLAVPVGHLPAANAPARAHTSASPVSGAFGPGPLYPTPVRLTLLATGVVSSWGLVYAMARLISMLVS